MLAWQAGESEVGSDEEEEEEAMDDSAMFRMDSMIAAVLRQGAAAKPNTQENKEHLRNFKFRCTTISPCYLLLCTLLYLRRTARGSEDNLNSGLVL